jgi:RNA polymerase sigma-70 factor, ECF subfamily
VPPDLSAEERFTAVYRRYHASVLAYALRRVDADAAQDVLAETFTAAWRELANLPADPLPWLYRAAGYRIANERRSASRRARLATRVTGMARDAEADHAHRVVESTRLLAELRKLSESDREALLLVCWEDLDHAAAAYVLGCSVATLKVRLFRARRRLAHQLSRQQNLPIDDPGPIQEVTR